MEIFLAGATVADTARAVGVSYPTVRHWCKIRAEPKLASTALRCFRCRRDAGIGSHAHYAYLLGLYLGDGHLTTSSRVPVLRISCSNAWPGLVSACDDAMRAVLARNVQRVQQPGCVSVQSSGTHWPCLFPQHGPGKKHERSIVLADWQREIVERHPGHFLRGLFHSDGCRFSNRVTTRGKEYVYPRYMFSNESADIMALCRWALDLLDIAWRMNRRNCLSVARRDAVAALDRHVGPKS
ncbi:hypothetical protein JD76_00651 [Micromonospora endolithica]|nr:hypothetical protein JD76_00651 [Micromonospora endolithica]